MNKYIVAFWIFIAIIILSVVGAWAWINEAFVNFLLEKIWWIVGFIAFAIIVVIIIIKYYKPGSPI